MGSHHDVKPEMQWKERHDVGWCTHLSAVVPCQTCCIQLVSYVMLLHSVKKSDKKMFTGVSHCGAKISAHWNPEKYLYILTHSAAMVFFSFAQPVAEHGWG